jgi:ParB family transcriptional regulator, chromosome partitioning protein
MDASNSSRGQSDSTKPRRLGRGLSGLLNLQQPVQVAPPSMQPESPESQPETVNVPKTSSLSDVVSVPLAAIRVSPYQPRRSFDESALSQLAASIKQSGVMQPILVRPVSPALGLVRFELIAGERRWRAAELAGLESLPAIVRELSNETAAEWALIENVQREDLNPMDRAFALRSLVEKFNLTQEQLGERLGLERSTIANLLRLATLQPEIAELISAGKLSGGHGKALLSIQNLSKRVEIAKLAAQFGWSVRKIEQIATEISSGPTSNNPLSSAGEPNPRQAVLRDLERQIGAHLGTKVHINTDAAGKRGRLVIEFYGLDHFDGVLNKLGFSAAG